MQWDFHHGLLSVTALVLVLASWPQAQGTAPAAPGPTPAPPPAPTESQFALPKPKEAGLHTIVIDPGHGGDDLGVRGPKGAVEKAITLEVAQRLKSLVESRLGIRVVMTRDDDRAVTPDARDALANNSKADLLLSIHANGALSPSAAGAEVYSLRLDREGEDVRRNSASTALVVPAIDGGTRPIDIVPWDLAQALHVDESAALASLLEDELRKRVPMGARALQQAPLRALASANMPAALIEIAYLTNPDQAQTAQSAEFQGSVAQALFDAVLRFRDGLEAAPPAR